MALKRILEPEVMDTERDALEYDLMDFTEVNQAFATRAIELAPPSGRILDMATGTARIPILILGQMQSKDLSIHAIDLSRQMLKVARRNVESARLNGRLTLELVDAKDLRFRTAEFDMVISNSLAHHVPRPSEFFIEVARVVRPGGGIFLRDLMRPKAVADVNFLVQKYAADADEYQRKLYRDSLYAALTLEEVECYVQEAGISEARIVQSSDRHWTVERAAKMVDPPQEGHQKSKAKPTPHSFLRTS
ncbi:MAG: class I SAM-dependent methyltransferase [Ignavibacteria bacterium]|nr:class I SAM-dependent methyltransferase [Ignavibacteria bacterium]